MTTIEIIAATMSVISLILICFILARIGKMRIFRFVVGEFAIATAVAYGFLAAQGKESFALPTMVLWFIAGSIHFAHAVFWATE